MLAFLLLSLQGHTEVITESLETIDINRVNINYRSFSIGEVEAFKDAFAYKLCHIICRAQYLNQFVSEPIKTIDITKGTYVNHISFSHRIQIGAAWFMYPLPISVPAYEFADVMIAHEFGHLFFDDLSRRDKEAFRALFNELDSASISAFTESRYVGTSILGHPKSGPSELFASAFALRYALPIAITHELDTRVLVFTDAVLEPIRQNPQQLCRMWN